MGESLRIATTACCVVSVCACGSLMGLKAALVRGSLSVQSGSFNVTRRRTGYAIELEPWWLPEDKAACGGAPLRVEPRVATGREYVWLT